MNIKCPHCDAEYEVDESVRGRKVECATCGTVWISGETNILRRKPAENNFKQKQEFHQQRNGFNGFTCPHCGAKNGIEHENIGRFVNCEICGKGFIAGTGTQPQEKEVDKKIGSRKEYGSNRIDFKCPHCGKIISVYGTRKDLPRTCPQCHRNIDDEQSHKQIYICTHCGASTTTPTQLAWSWGCLGWGCLFCLGILIVLLVVPGFLFMIMPILGIVAFVLILVFLCIFLCSSLNHAGKYFCKNCNKYDTLVPATSPRGQQMIKERENGYRKSDEHASSVRQESPEDRLMKLQKLKEVGIISEEEYEEKRRKILAQI